MTSMIVMSRAHGKIVVNLYNFQNVWIHKCEFMDCHLTLIYLKEALPFFLLPSVLKTEPCNASFRQLKHVPVLN